jgi:glycine cleavage system H lipoate-binding protein
MKSVVYWPVSGTVASVNEALPVRDIEEKDWLVELILDGDLQSSSLLTESEYLKVVQEQGPGLFGDEDDAARLGYTSYG